MAVISCRNCKFSKHNEKKFIFLLLKTFILSKICLFAHKDSSPFHTILEVIKVFNKNPFFYLEGMC